MSATPSPNPIIMLDGNAYSAEDIVTIRNYEIDDGWVVAIDLRNKDEHTTIFDLQEVAIGEMNKAIAQWSLWKRWVHSKD